MKAMLPVCISFDDLKSQMVLNAEEQPCLSLALTLQLPLQALVEALLDFQSQHSGLSATAKAWEPRRPPPGTGPTPPVRQSSFSASAAAATRSDVASVATEEQRVVNLPVIKESVEMGPQPPSLEQPIPRCKDKEITFDTPITELHGKYKDYIDRTTWIFDESRKEDLWVLHDESSLASFVAVPLSAPRLGREVKHQEEDPDEVLMAKLRLLAEHKPKDDTHEQAAGTASVEAVSSAPSKAIAASASEENSNVVDEAEPPAVDMSVVAPTVQLPGRGNHKRQECKQQ